MAAPPKPPPPGWTSLLTWTFQGDRFDEHHGVDLADLKRLGRVRDVLVEIVKQRWRQDHPGERLPQKFDETIRLETFDIFEGSSALAICYPSAAHGVATTPAGAEAGTGAGAGPTLEEMSEATEIAVEGYRSFSESRDEYALPERFPRRALNALKDSALSLGEHERVKIEPNQTLLQVVPVQIDAKFPQRVLSQIRIKPTAVREPGRVRVSGTVTEVNEPERRAEIKLPDGMAVTVWLGEEHLPSATWALHDTKTFALYVEGIATFDLEGTMRKIGDVTNAAALKMPITQRWKDPCESMFRALLAEDPVELNRLVTMPGLQPADLTYAVEHLGRVDNAELVVPTLLVALRHPSPLVREGAIYGISNHLAGRADVRAALEKLAAKDLSEAVRTAAKEALSI